MTNVDVLRAFAEDTTTHSSGEAYYFEHSREDWDFSNLYDADSATDEQIKMFHYTSSIVPEISEAGTIHAVRYTGVVAALIKSDLDETIDVQKDTDKEDGKYEQRVKSLIDGGGVLDEILEFMRCHATYDHEISFSDIQEVYNFFDANMDGIFFRYEILIRN